MARNRLHWCGASTRELQAMLRQQLQRFGIRGCLCKPHALRHGAVMAFVVGNAPANLGDAIALAGQRHDDVVVDLRHRRAVAAVVPAAAPFAVENHPVGARRIFLEPAQERGAEVEADARVVVHDARDLVLDVLHARRSVGGIALGADAFVPVVIRSSRVLRLHRLQPGILPRRLIEMSMNTDETFT